MDELKLLYSTVSYAFKFSDKKLKKHFVHFVLVNAILSFLDFLLIILASGLSSRALKHESSIMMFSGLTNGIIDVLGLRNCLVILGLGLLARTSLTLATSRMFFRFLGKAAANLSVKVLNVYLSRPIHEVDKFSLIQVLRNTTIGVEQFIFNVAGLTSLIISDGILISLIFLALLFLEPKVSLTLGLLIFPLVYLYFKRIGTRSRRMSRDYLENQEVSEKKVTESILLAREYTLQNSISKALSAFANIRLKMGMTLADQNFIPLISKYLLESFAVLGILLIALVKYLYDGSSNVLVTVSIFMLASSRLLPSTLRLTQNYIEAKRRLASSESVINFLNKNALRGNFQTPELKDNSKLNKLDFTPSIVLSDVTFTFPANEVFSIMPLTATIEPNSLIAIVGPSGSGKSTLVDLILGLNPPNSGSILINNIEAHKVSKEWPGIIAYVPQNIQILSGTLRENLIFNLNLPKSDKDLIDALRKAQLGKMIDSGEINLDTRLEFGGGGLSGGQRQRIGIARALLNHPSILVLDEPTSALDSQTELEIVKLLQNLKSSATIILIAHRTSIMKIADEIWNLDNGILDFKGQFDELSVTKPQENSDEK